MGSLGINLPWVVKSDKWFVGAWVNRPVPQFSVTTNPAFLWHKWGSGNRRKCWTERSSVLFSKMARGSTFLFSASSQQRHFQWLWISSLNSAFRRSSFLPLLFSNPSVPFTSLWLCLSISHYLPIFAFSAHHHHFTIPCTALSLSFCRVKLLQEKYF